ncbi:MAG TPA: hypothetical protein VER39_16405 [Nocardioidaceae bacterium]|nr:hypothetical protein [Nocardioidaceae bacterium]
MTLLLSKVHGAAALGGRALGTATAALGGLRPADKPLHPRGAVVPAVLRRTGSSELSGAAWLDEPGEDEILVRRSRSAGLPAPAPDVLGLSLRVPTSSGSYGDLLFATTGTGRLTRFLLRPAWSPYGRGMTTLLPYRTATGPVLLGALQTDERTVDLLWARGAGGWWRFATASLADDPASSSDASISFDPVRNTLPGLEVYDWVQRLREPAYLAARRSRGLPG